MIRTVTDETASRSFLRSRRSPTLILSTLELSRNLGGEGLGGGGGLPDDRDTTCALLGFWGPVVPMA